MLAAEQFSGEDIAIIVGVVVLLGATALLARAETALTRINRVRAIALDEEGRKHARTLLRLVQEGPEKILNTLLLLILACQTILATIVGIEADKWFGAWGIAVGLLFEIAVIFVFAEAAPKTWALLNPDKAALASAPLVRALTSFPPLRLVARGLVGVANVVLPGKGLPAGPSTSEEELLALAGVAEEEDVIEQEERQLIHSIIEFGDTVVREVMVPRPDMVTLQGSASVDDALEIALAAGYSRIPVFEQGIDDIVGLLFTKDLIRSVQGGGGSEPCRSLARDCRFVPETKRVAQLLREMQQGKFHLAVVVDEYGGTAGIVTLEDLIEELVGEIVDEFDIEAPSVEELANGELLVDGSISADELAEMLSARFPEGDYDSVGGLMIELLGHLPAQGETAPLDRHVLTAEQVHGRRIVRVRVTPRPKPRRDMDDSDPETEELYDDVDEPEETSAAEGAPDGGDPVERPL